ncbi:von Willebrand factor type A domain-containing protein [Pelolinea submarina]|uniref:von Willebrand factor type A domain-containing protein n=2 Tax=Pelolinea submarina TaxID=913107 RepID=A0A3E0AIE3_9CHLR|nr:von Willebrand factor type A domain-containing protein [Pelolinea submarina]
MLSKDEIVHIDISEIDAYENEIINISNADLLSTDTVKIKSQRKKEIQKDNFKKPIKPLVNIVLLIDTSGSMGASDYKPNRLGAAKEAARMFSKRKVVMNYSDHVAIIGFGGEAHVFHQLDSNLDEVMQSIEKLSITHTGTNIGSAIQSGANLLKNINGKKAMVLLSDGADKFDSSNPERQAQDLNDIKVFTIGIGTTKGGRAKLPHGEQTVFLNEDRLKTIAKVTGGRYIYTPTVMDLQKIYIELADY